MVENSINLVLSSLKIKLFFEDHSDTVSRSDSNSCIHFFRFFSLERLYRVESPAYYKELQVKFSAKSIMYNLRRTGLIPKLSLKDKLLSST